MVIILRTRILNLVRIHFPAYFWNHMINANQSF